MQSTTLINVSLIEFVFRYAATGGKKIDKITATALFSMSKSSREVEWEVQLRMDGSDAFSLKARYGSTLPQVSHIESTRHWQKSQSLNQLTLMSVTIDHQQFTSP